MKYSKTYPDFTSIESQVRRAEAERAYYLGTLFADACLAFGRGLRTVASSVAAGIQAQRKLRGLEAHAMVKEAAPRF